MADPLQEFLDKYKDTGLLGLGPTADDKQKAMTMGLISAGLGILSANAQNPRGAGFAGALGGAAPGLQMYQQTLQAGPKERIQNMQGIMQIAGLKKQLDEDDFFKSLMDKWNKPPAVTTNPDLGVGGMSTPGGGQMNPVTGQSLPAPVQDTQSMFKNNLDIANIAAWKRPQTANALYKGLELSNPDLKPVDMGGSNAFANPKTGAIVNSVNKTLSPGEVATQARWETERGSLSKEQQLSKMLDIIGIQLKGNEAFDKTGNRVDIAPLISMLSNGQSTGVNQPSSPPAVAPSNTTPRSFPRADVSPTGQTAIDRKAILMAERAMQKDPVEIANIDREIANLPKETPKRDSPLGVIPKSSVVTINNADNRIESAPAPLISRPDAEVPPSEKRKLIAEQPKAISVATAAIAPLQRLGSVADELRNHKGLDNIVGVVNRYPALDILPETRSARALQETTLSQAITTALQNMRDASKTGGALGNVTEKELELLEKNLAALGTKQGTSDYKVALENLSAQVNASINRIKKEYEGMYGTLNVPASPYVSQGRSTAGNLSQSEQRELDDLRRRFKK